MRSRRVDAREQHQDAMTLDERLRHAFDTLAERVRDEVAARAKTLIDELTAAVEAERADAVAMAAKDAQSAAETKRAAMFLRKEGRLQSWRLAGFGDAAQGGVDLAVPESGMLGEAARTGALVKDGVAPAFAALPPDRPAVAIPLVMSGQVFAVLYADQGVSDAIVGESWTATLEVLSRHAARALEAVTALRLAQVASERAKARKVSCAFAIEHVSVQ